jgi:hypothetical protein
MSEIVDFDSKIRAGKPTRHYDRFFLFMVYGLRRLYNPQDIEKFLKEPYDIREIRSYHSKKEEKRCQKKL